MKQRRKAKSSTDNPFMKMKEESLVIKGARLKALIGVLLSAALLVGCNSGSSDGMNESSSLSLLSGIFIDSPVEGLEYETETQNSMTDADGAFMYMEGESITFYVGDIMLGGAMAQSIMTPVDLVDGAVDETHPMVTNMARFLQTLDVDMDPENGITITEEMSDAMVGHMVNFDMDMNAFEYDPDMMAVMDTINTMDTTGEWHMMVSIEDAQNHLANTIAGMMNGDPGMMNSEGINGNQSETKTGQRGMMPGITPADQTNMLGSDTGIMSSENGMM